MTVHQSTDPKIHISRLSPREHLWLCVSTGTILKSGLFSPSSYTVLSLLFQENIQSFH